MPRPSPLYLYRIIHIDNLRFIISEKKITAPSHAERDPDYISIGDTSLISSRSIKKIELEPNGLFTDYIAFYFGARSPMLYNIHHGFRGVQKRPQEEIIYLIATFERISELGLPYVFFDGHGYHNFSQIFNNEDGFSEIDWDAVSTNKWFDTDEDPDRKRRKQAELLVHREMPIEALYAIGVFGQQVKDEVEGMLSDCSTSMEVVVFKGGYY